MRTLDYPLPDQNAPARLANDELREVVTAYIERELELLKDLEEAELATIARKDEFDHKDSKIRGLQRRLDAVDTEKIAILVYSPTGHHKVELAGPWTMSNYADLVKTFKLQVHLQDGDSKNKEAVATMRERAQIERDNELEMSRMSTEERTARNIVPTVSIPVPEEGIEPDGTVNLGELDKAMGNGPQPDGDVIIEELVSGMADFTTAELPQPEQAEPVKPKQGDKRWPKKSQSQKK